MTFSMQNDFGRSAAADDAEKTLRLIASLPAPKGIEQRLKAGLHATPPRTQVILWPSAAGSRDGWIHTSAMRAAAAAAIVFVVAGGGWEVFSHIRVAPVPAAVAAPPSINGPGAFSTGAARRTPQTLERPVIVAPATVKPKTENRATARSSARRKTPSAQKQVSTVGADQ